MRQSGGCGIIDLNLVSWRARRILDVVQYRTSVTRGIIMSARARLGFTAENPINITKKCDSVEYEQREIVSNRTDAGRDMSINIDAPTVVKGTIPKHR